MRKIEVIIRPEKFKDVETAVRKMGIGGMTYYPVKGFGSQRTPGREAADNVKIEFYVDEFQTDKLVETIMREARTDTPGDGKIVVVPLDTIYRIRTKEEGPKAI